MPIAFHAQSQTFHLFNPFVSYIFKILPSGHLGQLYYGKALRDRPDFDRLFETAPRSMSVCYFEDDSAYSLEHIKQEYASYGTGELIRWPALQSHCFIRFLNSCLLSPGTRRSDIPVPTRSASSGP